MIRKLNKYVWLVLVISLLASCTSSSKKVVVVKSRHDNGQHKGWYKNPNNPHHPLTTNPGHTKKKTKHGASGKGAAKKKNGKG